MYRGTRRLQAADRRSRETEVEKEASLKKNRLRAADRRAQMTQKEKEACLGKNPIRSVWIKMLSNVIRSSTNLLRVNQACYDGPLPADH